MSRLKRSSVTATHLRTTKPSIADHYIPQHDPAWFAQVAQDSPQLLVDIGMALATRITSGNPEHAFRSVRPLCKERCPRCTRPV